jgi:hypothetical protein
MADAFYAWMQDMASELLEEFKQGVVQPLSGLHDREGWSSAIVRAASAAEISANYFIRRKFAEMSDFDAQFVDERLLWANGLRGEIERFILKLERDPDRLAELKKLQKIALEIINDRNSVVHSGRFSSPDEAKLVEKHARQLSRAWWFRGSPTSNWSLRRPYASAWSRMQGTVMSETEINLKREIAWEIYDAMAELGADQELLGAIAIWADGKDDERVLNQLRSHNRTGSIYKKVICRGSDS